MNKLVVAVALTLASIAAAAETYRTDHVWNPQTRLIDVRSTGGYAGGISSEQRKALREGRARSCTVTKQVEKDINGRFKKGATHSEVVCQ